MAYGSKSKYKNIKVVVEGKIFHSKKEGNRYLDLLELEKKRLIYDLILQPRFTLLDKMKWNGITLYKRSYIADFQYIDTVTGDTIVEDVKGFLTPIYKLKRHLFLSLYPGFKFIET